MPEQVLTIAKKYDVEVSEVLVVAKKMGPFFAKYITTETAYLDNGTAEELKAKINKEIEFGNLKKKEKPQNIVKSAANDPPKIVTRKQDIEEKHKKSSASFERYVGRILSSNFKNSKLSNILIFDPKKAKFDFEHEEQVWRSDYALEVDHILHIPTHSKDLLIIIECKNQLINIEKTNGKTYWNAQYRNKPKSNVIWQLERHVSALRAYINPLSVGRELEFHAFVVTSDALQQHDKIKINGAVSYYLLYVNSLFEELEKLGIGSPARVAQSEILNLLRLGIPVEELGHPELNNSLRYINRCRRNIDEELYQSFRPTERQWAINGSAGMGKSVLLAYSVFVFSSNLHFREKDGKLVLEDFGGDATRIGLPQQGIRKVYVFAFKEKQRQTIIRLYEWFISKVLHVHAHERVFIGRPEFRLWNGEIPSDCHALVIDEAHDLSPADSEKVSKWHSADNKRYLLVACDRHQKLSLSGRESRIIEGLNFSSKTKKLRLNYRNPFPVYAASLGLMFRWFSKSGPKVIPVKENLEKEFGFLVHGTNTSRISLSMRNDSHPGNSWSNCVETFLGPESAFARLRQYNFKSEDVLWVRFCGEDPHFNYEQLAIFSYHNLNCPESVDITDKYIKGQDFPIVVIEGLSDDMCAYRNEGEEELMWQQRRKSYICTSRATAFLFLVIPRSESHESTASEEFREITKQLHSPFRSIADGFSRTWGIDISIQEEHRRKMESFTDITEN